MEKRAYVVICLAVVLFSAGCANSPPGTTGNNGKAVTTQGGGLANDVAGLFSGRPAEYMAEYESTTVVNNEQSKSIHAYYYRGDQMRIDTTNDAMESRFYMSKAEFIQCNKQGGEWSCMKMQDAQSQPTGQDPAQGMDKLKNNIEENKATRLPDRVIVGVTCKCFYTRITINMPQAKEAGMSDMESTYCLSPEGVPLYTESKSENMHSITEATKYSTRVSDADFIPPAEPKTMEEAVGGGTQQNEQPPETLPADFKEKQCAACDKMPTEESKQECIKTFEC